MKTNSTQLQEWSVQAATDENLMMIAAVQWLYHWE